MPTVLAAHAVDSAGTTEQKNRWLPAIATGGARATTAFVDADLAWDPQSTATRAEKVGAGCPRFASWLLRLDNREALLPLLESRFASEPRDHWLGLLAKHDIPAAPVQTMLDFMNDPAVRHLDMSVGYAKVREQFGQPIGSFQAIRHKCAEMLLSVENSHAAVYYAAWALDAKAEDAALAASVAKSYVSEAARHVCGEAIQVHGGIGFTWEYDLHLYMKRAKALEPMYGDADWHREQILRLVPA
ncbi:MAG: hypothetical protein DME08_16140 [Candidatus Rokuibacteriota bacterium]|nr:MAG: hypothetical protein DME08_16140 [Candidatus Rokubacteria bacterium]